MEIPNELYLPFLVALGLLIERTYIPFRIASNSKQWPRRVTEATAMGIGTAIVSFLLARAFYSLVVLNSDFLLSILQYHKAIFPSQYSGSLLFSLLLIVVVLWLLNLPYKSQEKLLSLLKSYGSPIEQLFVYSLSKMVPLMLTFKNGWVYVVLVTELPNVGAGERYLEVLTLYSGYKEKDNSIIRITESHTDIIKMRVESGKEHKSTVIVLDDLISVTPFDIEEFNKRSTQPTTGTTSD